MKRTRCQFCTAKCERLLKVIFADRGGGYGSAFACQQCREKYRLELWSRELVESW